jgi:hypothetical protein
MSVTASGPDGSTFSFPDGTPPDVVRGALAKHYGWSDGSTPRGGPDSAPASGDIDHSWPARLADNMRAVASGATLGASPRIAAALESATGLGGEAGDYSGNLARRQNTEDEYAKAHPVLSGIGNLTGNVAGLAAVSEVPGLAALLPDAAPTLLGKIGQGMAGGAAVGTVQGVNDAPDWSDVGATVNSGFKGAGSGAVLGGAVAPVGAAIGKGYSALVDALRNPYPAGISRTAGNIVSKGLDASMPGEVDANLAKLGPEGMLADASDPLQGKASGAVSNSLDARAQMVAALQAREAGTAGRLNTAATDNFGKLEPARMATARVLGDRSALDAQNYGAALDGSGAPPVDAQPVVDLIDDHLKTAVGEQKKALTRLRAEMMEPNPDLAPGGGADPEPPAEVPTSNARKLHGLKMELDNVIEHDQPGLGVQAGALKSQNRSLTMARGAINDALETQVPGYSRANAISAPLARKADAIEFGTKLLNTGPEGLFPQEVAARLRGFDANGPEERAGAQIGVRSDIGRRFGQKANPLTPGKAIAGGFESFNPANIGHVFDPARADNFVNAVGKERSMALTHDRLLKGSMTEPRQAAEKAMSPDKVGTLALVKGLIASPLKAATSPLLHAILPDTTAAYPEVARILSAQGPQRDAYLRALRGRSAASQATAIKGQSFGNRAALAAALLANGALHSGPKTNPRRVRLGN